MAKIIISKRCEKAYWKALDITKASGRIFIDFINPEFKLIEDVAEVVTAKKKLYIIRPKKRYRGYWSIDFSEITPPKNKRITKNERGSSKYQKTPR